MPWHCTDNSRRTLRDSGRDMSVCQPCDETTVESHYLFAFACSNGDGVRVGGQWGMASYKFTSATQTPQCPKACRSSRAAAAASRLTTRSTSSFFLIA